ncbi:acyl-lipid (9-3)-desaturase-like [Silene latifolia]|uniref:acyl-lipid (9-3)-desaturase-like n=1 Tax=Silene latifolia TaxID=37657 RepID=UPI003D7814F9
MEKTKTFITKEELKTHNKKDDVWISIYGKIYNVTNWANHHPGGELPLLYYSGQDATDVFLAYHPQSSSQHLNQFFTGYYLKDYDVSEISKDYRNLISEFHKMGLFENKGHGVFITMCFVVIMFLLCVYGVVSSNSYLVHVFCAILLGCSWIQCGWMGHDSAHYQAMVSPWWNRLMQSVFGNCLTGVGASWWKWTHNAHHIACNSLEFDPDVQLMPFLAVSSKFFNSLTSHFHEKTMNFDSFTRFLVSNQHITFYPIVACLRVFMFVQSFNLLFSNRKVVYKNREIIALLVFWVWYPLLISYLPNWYEKITFVVISLGLTGVQHFQFSLNHLSCDVYTGPLSGGDWFEKQTIGSLDIACPSWMDWFHGGLQFQIEHHLFPRMPRCHLRKISPLVKGLCNKHHIPYKCVSFWKANNLTFSTLRTAALEARNPINSAPRNLVWEAMTSQG